MSEKTGKRLTIAALLAWIVLQLYTSFDITAHNFYLYHICPPGTTIALAGLWLLCLLALDVLLYSFRGRRPLRALKWYWGACAVLVAALCLLNELIAFGVMTFGITSWPLLAALMAFVALLSRITPFPQMQLASYLLFKTELDLAEKIVFMGGIALTFLLIGGHFLWLRRLERRAAEEAERTST